MSEPRQPDRVERFFGAGLVAVGALIFALCGLCTLAFAGWSLLGLAQHPLPVLGSLLLSAVVGGLPTLGGFMLVRFGWQMYRGAPSRPPKASMEIFDE